MKLVYGQQLLTVGLFQFLYEPEKDNTFSDEFRNSLIIELLKKYEHYHTMIDSTESFNEGYGNLLKNIFVNEQVKVYNDLNPLDSNRSLISINNYINILKKGFKKGLNVSIYDVSIGETEYNTKKKCSVIPVKLTKEIYGLYNEHEYLSLTSVLYFSFIYSNENNKENLKISEISLLKNKNLVRPVISNSVSNKGIFFFNFSPTFSNIFISNNQLEKKYRKINSHSSFGYILNLGYLFPLKKISNYNFNIETGLSFSTLQSQMKINNYSQNITIYTNSPFIGVKSSFSFTGFKNNIYTSAGLNLGFLRSVNSKILPKRIASNIEYVNLNKEPSLYFKCSFEKKLLKGLTLSTGMNYEFFLGELPSKNINKLIYNTSENYLAGNISILYFNLGISYCFDFRDKISEDVSTNYKLINKNTNSTEINSDTNHLNLIYIDLGDEDLNRTKLISKIDSLINNFKKENSNYFIFLSNSSTPEIATNKNDINILTNKIGTLKPDVSVWKNDISLIEKELEKKPALKRTSVTLYLFISSNFYEFSLLSFINELKLIYTSENLNVKIFLTKKPSKIKLDKTEYKITEISN